MVPKAAARGLGIAAAVLLAVAAVWVFAASASDPAQRIVALVGVVLLVVAFAVVGYGLVRSAPVWLRVIPTVGLPLLVVAVASAVRPAVEDAISGPRADATSYLLAAAVALAVGLSQRVEHVPHRH